MRNVSKLAGITSALLIAGATCAIAQSPPAPAGSAGAPGSTRSPASGDTQAREAGDTQNLTSQEFVTKAAQSNLAEIKASQLALSKTQNPQVRSFAQKMIDDHQKASSKLAPIARSQNLKVPDDTDMMHKASMQMLESKSGDAFDKAYIEQMTKDHEKAVALFESAASSQKVDKELQTLASSLLPTLHEHHAQVEKLNSGRSASASESSATSR